MADAASRGTSPRPFVRAATGEGALARAALIAVGAGFLLLFVAVPLVSVFVEAFGKGLQAYLDALVEPDALSALRLTLTVAAIAVPLNAVLGLRPRGASPNSPSRARAC